jgi:hypothetical protein
MTDETDPILNENDAIPNENADFSQEKQEQPWLKQPGETVAWHIRFMRYVRMGPRRSLLGAFNAEREERGKKKRINVSGAFYNHVIQFDWKRRAAAYDKYIEAHDQAEWEKRRRAYRKRETAYAEALLKKAEQMLQFPLATTEQTTETEGGRTIIKNVITPTRWTIRDAATMTEIADKLYRLALEMETSRTSADVLVTDDIDEIRDRRWQAIQPLLPDVLAEDAIADDGSTTDRGLNGEQDSEQSGP